jgi:hypothetical protein
MKRFRLGMSPHEKADMREKANNMMKKFRLGISPDEKKKKREKETLARKKLRDGISPDERVNMTKKAINTMKRLRDGMFSNEKAKMREKETIARKRLRDGISPDEKVKMREKETIGRKRLRLAKNDIHSISPKNDFKYKKEAKNIYTGLKILKMCTYINPLYVSFMIDLLLERKKINYMAKDNISAHTEGLSVENYKRYYETVLVPEVRN